MHTFNNQSSEYCINIKKVIKPEKNSSTRLNLITFFITKTVQDLVHILVLRDLETVMTSVWPPCLEKGTGRKVSSETH